MTRTLGLFSLITPEDGFHPTSMTRIVITNDSVLPSSVNSNCYLHLYFSLPPLIFIDPYELSNHEQFYTFKYWGTANLELPVQAVSQNNSWLLLNVNLPPEHVFWTHEDPSVEADDIDVALEIKVPLHLRYGNPASASNSGYYITEMDWPAGFLLCPQSLPVSLQSQIIKVLPPEVLSFLDAQTAVAFAAPYVLVPIQSLGSPNNHNLHPPRIEVRVPVASLTDLRFVEPGLVITVLASFFFLVWISMRTARKMRMAFGSVEVERLKME